MTDPYKTNDEFFDALRSLIDGWCDRRCLPVLAAILPSYVSFNGLTDGWGELHLALRNVQAFRRDLLTPTEQVITDDLRRAAEHVVFPRI